MKAMNNMKITEIVECTDDDVVYGFIIADEKYDIQEEINRIKHSREFKDEYGDDWCIEDIFGEFSFPFEYQDFDWDSVAEI